MANQTTLWWKTKRSLRYGVLQVLWSIYRSCWWSCRLSASTFVLTETATSDHVKVGLENQVGHWLYPIRLKTKLMSQA